MIKLSEQIKLKVRSDEMSAMCKLGSSCSTRKGMCIHEKFMAGVMVMAMVAGLAYWLV